MKRRQVKQNKAFLGAVIGGITGLAGSLIAGSQSKKMAEKQAEQQQIAQNKNDTYQMAANLSNAYNNQEYVNQFNDKVTFKSGGKMKRTKVNSRNIVSNAKKFACGGRKKASWGLEDTTSVISGATNALSNIINSTVNKADTTIKRGLPYTATAKENIKQPDYIANPDNLINPNAVYMRCGGRAKSKCGGRTKKSCGGRK